MDNYFSRQLFRPPAAPHMYKLTRDISPPSGRSAAPNKQTARYIKNRLGGGGPTFAIPGPRRVRNSVAFPWFFGNCWWSPQYLVISRGKSLVAFQIEQNAAEEVRQILDPVKNFDLVMYPIETSVTYMTDQLYGTRLRHLMLLVKRAVRQS
jgi:hypothetical protein